MTALPDEYDDLDAVADDEMIVEPEPQDHAATAEPDALDAEASTPKVSDLDLEIEELLSSEGIPAADAVRAPMPAPISYHGESSLDDLLDTFDDEELAAEAFAEAEAYGGPAMPPALAAVEAAAAPTVAPVAPREPGPGPSARKPEAQQPLAAEALPVQPVASEAPTALSASPAAAALAAARARRARSTSAQPEAAPMPQPAASAAPASRSMAKQRSGFWRGLGLVLLGGLVGVVLTLLGLMIWSGTLSFASRAHVEALSRNMGTMQSNQELTWGRVDALAPQLAAQEDQVAQAVQALAQSQQELADMREQAAASEARVYALSQELDAMQQQLTTALAQADERMVTLEGQTAQLDAGLTELEETVSPLRAAVQRFEDFLTSMRELLLKLQPRP